MRHWQEIQISSLLLLMIHLEEMQRQTHLEFGRQRRGGERRATDLRRQAVELAEDLRSDSQNHINFNLMEFDTYLCLQLEILFMYSPALWVAPAGRA